MTTKAPPGPKPLPIVGNLPDFRRDPLAFLTKASREHGEIVRLKLGPKDVYLLTSPEEIGRILVTNNKHFIKTPALRVTKPVLGEGLLLSEGDFHLRQRRMMQPAFHKERIAGYGEVMVERTVHAARDWQHGDVRDMADEMMHLTLAIVAKTLFNANLDSEADELGQALTHAMEWANSKANYLFPIPDFIPTPTNLKFKRAAALLDQTIYRMLHERRASGEDPGDLLSMLLHAQDEDDGGHMSDQQVRDEAMTLFLAGHETTANALAWTWYLLSQNPEAEAKLVRELQTVLGGCTPTMADLPLLPYTNMVISESMRLFPPAWIQGREALGDYEVGRYRVKQGDALIFSQWVMHRDPRFFDEPERFMPDRWTDGLAKRLPAYAYFPFGGGTRLCIGKQFALMEAALILATLAQRWRFDLVPGHPIETEPLITLRPKHGVKMVLTAR